MDERALVGRLKRGDESAFREFVRTHQGRVMSLLYRLLGERTEAEDIAQDVFVTIFSEISSFRGDSRLSTWLYRITYNHALNRIKHRARRAHGRSVDLSRVPEHLLDPSHTEAMPRPDELAVAHEGEQVVQRLLQELAEDQRAVLVLREIEGLSYEEIAMILTLPEGTVKSRLHRARAELARGWAAYRDGTTDAPCDPTRGPG